MRKKTPRAAQDSALASGWTVEAEPELKSVAVNAEPGDGNDLAEGADLDTETNGSDLDGSGADGETSRFSNAALVLLGVCGGLYLLYAWIWMSWAQYASVGYAETAAASGALGSVLLTVVYWLAPVAPLLWFLAALLMNHDRGMKRLVFWILLGAIVLVPLPVFAGGGAA